MKTITLTEGAFKQLQDLRHKTEDKNEAEVIRRALAIYDALTDQIMRGGTVIIRQADGSEILAPLF